MKKEMNTNEKHITGAYMYNIYISMKSIFSIDLSILSISICVCYTSMYMYAYVDIYIYIYVCVCVVRKGERTSVE